MTATIENLNLEEGKSEVLRAVLAGIMESSASDGGPRYSERVCRALARIIVCRSYAKPMLELSHLLAIASARDGRYEEVFWGVDRASTGEFRRAFKLFQGIRPDVRVSSNGVRRGHGADVFEISYRRMPLLAALLEFMIMTVGYPAVETMTAGLRQGELADENVLEAARAMQRSLYGYLKDHLPPVQRQRREHHFLGYADAHAGNRSGADVINDDVVMAYWRSYAASEDVDAKTFRSVYDTARRLVVALDAAADRFAGAYARSIGTDLEAGEVDPADVDAVVAAIDADTGPLDQVLETCGDTVKFINVGEADVLNELPLGDSTARRLPVSVLRNAVFGAVQLRISTALRRGVAPVIEIPDPAKGYYTEKLTAYAAIVAGTERLAMAALWSLFEAGRAEAVDLALALAPDLDWGQLARSAAEDADNVVSLDRAGALRQFFAVVPDARGDELAALLADARRTWRGVNRAGFRDGDGEQAVDVIAEATPWVLRLISSVRRTLDRDLGQIDWSGHEHADATSFAEMFGNLYDQGRKR
ncbi:MAG: hypothetical protein JJ900_02825 [Rhodospirillales bacterium]|nr:hypothetical protein [Rhodospirillales bacterium]MBO6785757.1 hypothetical protein [Rhodospirillales bacterium]